MATPNGLEPSTSSVTGWRANRLHHRAKSIGGNNRARTCDLLLVRQMLSQLSYAPVSEEVFTSATRHIIAQGGRFVKHFFQLFSENIPLDKTSLLPVYQMLFSSFSMSAGEKLWTASQNWQVMSMGLPSAAISESSLRPREIRAASILSREQ